MKRLKRRRSVLAGSDLLLGSFVLLPAAGLGWAASEPRGGRAR